MLWVRCLSQLPSFAAMLSWNYWEIPFELYNKISILSLQVLWKSEPQIISSPLHFFWFIWGTLEISLRFSPFPLHSMYSCPSFSVLFLAFIHFSTYDIIFHCYADGIPLPPSSLILQLQLMFCRSVWQRFRTKHLSFKVNLNETEVKLTILSNISQALPIIWQSFIFTF